MTALHEHQPAAPAIAGCPWCGSSATLRLAATGFGAVTVECASCGAKGPPAPVDGDFDAVDVAAIARWDERHGAVAADALAAVELSIGFHALLTEALEDATSIAVPYGALRRLVEAARPGGSFGRA